MPVVSVLMAFHRVTPYLRPAVQSVLQQSLGDLELVLVDNGTGAGLAPLGEDAKDPRVRLISLPVNQGISGGRNAAFAQASGEFIALLDHDDIALPQRLEKQVAVLRAQAGLGLVSSLAEGIDESGAVIGREFTLVETPAQKVYSQYTVPALASSYTGRRELFARIPFRPLFDFAEDYDFFSRVTEVTGVRAVPEVLVRYRYHAGQGSNEQAARQILRACMVRLITARRRQGRSENIDELVDLLGAWLIKPPAAPQIYDWFARRCLNEGFSLLSVYHARKQLSVKMTPGAVFGAARVALGAGKQSPRDAGKLLRMLFTGPLRTHKLMPS